MFAEMRVSAPAKINLNLKVLPKRADGFHVIESIFQTVRLFDDLLICIEDGKNTCTVECYDMELPEQNTLSAAYKAFCLHTGFDRSVRVRLTKRIPSGGGLGGGSSDAAYFIKALSQLANVRLSSELSNKIAGEVGSDVFFFLCCAHPGCALVTGRGEIVKPIKPRQDIHILLVFPGVHSSTGEAYSLVDKAASEGEFADCPSFEELETVYNGPIVNWTFANSFTPVIARRYPEIGAAIAEVRKAGAVFSDMSGSGSAVFGIFASAGEADIAFHALISKGLKCVAA
ncbi:4-(cytidine 5'-diphospho)-2-C-methyl-D-erythritol kinase [Treponema parvum]|uniref:4-diphosphocytidyl-2-C-methyl-D-erythritol kinase n=1 Tax=Treponema parvum TaxID=138851 RepID=A0A975IER3_9SPIR|nr:4-(cytidine 5'-diphospho)-2-C-methyl-D-erythritol kinase [Treponema parvum]QTQ14325.1 4-(cytidine 5'-diphospho)-2-C-methyl-D-erythritol kinase [Treponema parvum]